ncbi:MAG TPA: Spy/CpxP family protein refolding chaperone [Candidatus Eisenbacteria bacterium]|nr:Spy/CpxP family protein refolding chaperone [Candidatus Eisenbacteria bacterium]
MKSKWVALSLAVAVGLATMGAMARAQAPPAPGAPEVGAGPSGAMVDPGPPEDGDAYDGLDLLLAADARAGRGAGPGGPGGPGMRGGPRGRGGAGEELRAKLNLTDDQESRIADIRDRHERSAIPIQSDLRIASLDLRKLMRADRPDERAILAQIDKLSDLRGSLQKNRVSSMLEARSVLTPAQQKLMRESGGGFMGGGMRGHRGMRGGPGRQFGRM